MKLTDFKVLTLDCYGTLIDWERGMIDGLKPLTRRAARDLTADAILEAHARHESFQQLKTPSKPYREILAVVYRRLAEDWGVPASWDECLAYGRTIAKWPAFHDSAGALLYLKKHYKLVMLSNIDNESFAASNAKLQVEFDAIYTSEDIGSFKPSQLNFDYLFEKLKHQGYEKSDILHVAESMFHDHEPANKCGLASCWIYRRFDQPGFGAALKPSEMPSYDFRFNSMADLAKAHQEALRS